MVLASWVFFNLKDKSFFARALKNIKIRENLARMKLNLIVY